MNDSAPRHSARILDGRRIAEDLLDSLKVRVDARLAAGGSRPGLAVVVVWMSIAASQIAFRRHYVANGGRVEDLHFRVRGYPWVPLGAIACCLLACIGIAFDPAQRVALYFGLPFIAWCYFVYWVTRNKRAQRLRAEAGVQRPASAA